MDTCSGFHRGSPISMVYYRVVNTAMFIKALTTSFVFMDVLPLLIVAEIPLIWFIFYCLVLNKMLRKRSGKLALGWFINKLMSCFNSVTVFSLVARNLGLQVWGMSGVTATTSAPPVMVTTIEDKQAVPEEAFELAEALERGTPERQEREEREPSIL